MIRFVRVVTAAEIPSDRGRLVFIDGEQSAVTGGDVAADAGPAGTTACTPGQIA